VAVPKKKTSKSRRDRRRAHHDIIAQPAISKCPECGAPVIPHQVCPECGTYRGRQVIENVETQEEEA
jgi:large subunit ribosomal protein L32